jgi:hypothetical protein
MLLKMHLTVATETHLWEIIKRMDMDGLSKAHGVTIHPVALVARDINTRHWSCDKKQHKHQKYQSSIED